MKSFFFKGSTRALLWTSALVVGCGLSFRVAADVVPVSWNPCKAELVDPRWATVLGERLECGTMSARIDEDEPALGSIEVGLIRFKAGDPARRRGALFFNFGGPGGNPLDFMPGISYLWSTRALDHPLDGDKRRLSDLYDMVAVIPRGLRGGTRFACRVDEANDGHDPTVDLADWNWVGYVKESKAYAAGCAEDPLHAYVGTLQHVRDMEQARVALHEKTLNFVGFSYGTWVGSFYAATYPGHTGRVVLDSSMNHAGTFEDQVAEEPYERQERFARTALRPALAAPAIYGMGSSAGEIMARFRNMPHRVQEALPSIIDTPAELVAALTMADWVRTDGNSAPEHLLSRLRSYRFSPDPAVDNEIRSAATDFASLIEHGRKNDPVTAALVDQSVYVAVVCGDTAWQKSVPSLRRLANTIGLRYPAANGESVTLGLTCRHWASRPRWRPPLASLAKAPPMLMVHAEFDPATPVSGAILAFNATPNAYLVLARGMTGHGVFGNSATPCIERSVGRFLLEGELPLQRLSGCDFVPMPPSRNARDVNGTVDEATLRRELRRRLQKM